MTARGSRPWWTMHIERRRAPGKLVNLGRNARRSTRLPGTTGIGHTRWATHGAPTQRNAHPHGTPLRQRRAQRHHREPCRTPRRSSRRPARCSRRRPIPRRWRSWSTCTCVQGLAPGGRRARRLLAGWKGAYALALVFAGQPGADDRRAARGAAGHRVRRQAPCTSAATALALAPMTRRIAYLHDGDWTVLSPHRRRGVRRRRVIRV